MSGGGAGVAAGGAGALLASLPSFVSLPSFASRSCALASRRGRVSRDAWLPFVVYATEVGYDYSGDEPVPNPGI